MHRKRDWATDLAKSLKDKEVRKIFLTTLMEGEDGLTLVRALQHSITRIGLTEFSKMTHTPVSRISEFVNGKKKPQLETIEKFLKPFGLKLKLDVIDAA